MSASPSEIAASAGALEHWPLDRFRPYERNARTHSNGQIEQIMASIKEFGFTNPILASADGGVLAGHGRLAAAIALGLPTAPVVVLDHLTATQRRAYILADNRLALNAGWDDDILRDEIIGLDLENFDLDLLGFDEDEIADLLDPSPDAPPPPPSVSLADRFGIPPFSVLNAREGWWQGRKASWLALGIQSELGRGDQLINNGGGMASKQSYDLPSDAS